MFKFIKNILGISKLEKSRQILIDDIDSLNKVIICLKERIENLEKQSTLGVDVHMKTESEIFVLSTLRGGFVRRIPAHFKHYRELIAFVRHMEERFNTKTIWDVPHDYPRPELFHD